MKFKHGLFMGLFMGFSLGAIAEHEAAKRLEQHGDKEVDGMLSRLAAYNEGWIKGKNWSIFYHEAHHPDCNKCPH